MLYTRNIDVRNNDCLILFDYEEALDATEFSPPYHPRVRIVDVLLDSRDIKENLFEEELDEIEDKLFYMLEDEKCLYCC